MAFCPSVMYLCIYLVLYIPLYHSFSTNKQIYSNKPSPNKLHPNILHQNRVYNKSIMSQELPYVESLDFPYAKVRNLRVVPPYEHEFIAKAKSRWTGRSISEILHSEFISMDPQGLDDSFKKGRIRVERTGSISTCDPNFIIKEGDIIYHKTIVQEPPCLALSPNVIMDLPLVLVVSKPVGLPVYPTGTYRYNSLSKVLKIEIFSNHKIENPNTFFDGRRVSESDIQLLPLHRIDRLVSGIVVFAKSSEIASYLSQEIAQGRVQKVYLARVTGKFPTRATNLALEEGVYMGKGFIVPIDHKNGIHCFSDENVAHSQGKDMKPKPAETHFKFLSYSDELDESLILCYPKTGRTHQIRAHLKYLNHPISNDPTYGDPMFTRKGMDYPHIPHMVWKFDCGKVMLHFEDRSVTIDQNKFILGEYTMDNLDSNSDYIDWSIKGVGLSNQAYAEGSSAHCGGIFLHAIKYCWGASLVAEDAHPFWASEFPDSYQLINSALA